MWCQTPGSLQSRDGLLRSELNRRSAIGLDTPSRQNRESGIALLMVMLGMIVIGVLALGVVLATRSGVRQANSDLESSEMRAFFDAVILQAGVITVGYGQSQPAADRWCYANDHCVGARIPVSITSEFGKV